MSSCLEKRGGAKFKMIIRIVLMQLPIFIIKLKKYHRQAISRMLCSRASFETPTLTFLGHILLPGAKKETQIYLPKSRHLSFWERSEKKSSTQCAKAVLLGSHWTCTLSLWSSCLCKLLPTFLASL